MTIPPYGNVKRERRGSCSAGPGDLCEDSTSTTNMVIADLRELLVRELMRLSMTISLHGCPHVHTSVVLGYMCNAVNSIP